MVGYNIHKQERKHINGGGVMDVLLAPFSVNKYGNERHARSLDPKHFMQGYHFVGPFTELKLREKYHDDIPLNDLDQAAKAHDYSYLHEKEEYEKDYDKQKHLNNVWKADDVFIDRAKNSRDDPVVGKLARKLIQTKKNLEQHSLLDSKRFSGFGKSITSETSETSENSDPVAKLRQLVQVKYKKELKHDKKQRGGFLPLAAIATAAAGALASKLVGDLYEYVKKRITGKG